MLDAEAVFKSLTNIFLMWFTSDVTIESNYCTNGDNRLENYYVVNNHS